MKIALILSGCGVYDGSEIHEAVLTLSALEEQGAQVQCFAPDVDQMHVINHLSGDVMEETRNVLVESARITRGKILDLKAYKASEFDALILPGGFGAAKNLSSFAVEGADCSVQDDVASAVLAAHKAGKVIGVMCIAPTIVAKLIPGVTLTLGEDGDASQAAALMGATHKVCGHGEIVVDEDKRVVSTPCYMLDANIVQIADGARKLVSAVLAMAQ